MPRPRLPPTPLSSTDLAGQEQPQNTPTESVFALPLPALQPTSIKGVYKPKRRTSKAAPVSPPLSPQEERTTSSLQRKRTLSGENKTKARSGASSIEQTSEATLPPPPGRPRKIIQMKPKQQTKSMPEIQPELSMNATTFAAVVPMQPPQPAKRKQAQPPPTSAAGRKIARKTAHSIIERRRRSKMNEEFGVLKDMIPACAGVEMHKLAILQAGIEYVRYLESCVERLKTQSEHPFIAHPVFSPVDAVVEEEEDEDDVDEMVDVENDGYSGRAYDAAFTDARSESNTPSPNGSTSMAGLQPQNSLKSAHNPSTIENTTTSACATPDVYPVQSSYPHSLSSASQLSQSQSRPQTSTSHGQRLRSISPQPWTAQASAQTGVSPAFGAFQFGKDLDRASTWPSTEGRAIHNHHSPNILPLPQALGLTQLPSFSIDRDRILRPSARQSIDTNDGNAEATATVALLMMTNDHRGSVGIKKTSTGKGISVMDLLST